MLLANENIEQRPIENEDIISLIRKFNPNKAIGSDGICPFCDDTVILYQLQYIPICGSLLM